MARVGQRDYLAFVTKGVINKDLRKDFVVVDFIVRKVSVTTIKKNSIELVSLQKGFVTRFMVVDLRM